MRLSEVRLVGWFALIVCVTSPTAAQERYIYYSAQFKATAVGTSVNVFIGIDDTNPLAPIDHLEIRRRPHGSCEPLLPVGDAIPFEPGTVFIRTIVDATVEVDRSYEYQLAAYNSEDKPLDIQWGWGFPFKAWTAVGSAPITYGIIITLPYMVAPCATTCYGAPWYVELDESLVPYAGTGTPMLLYGHFVRFLPQFGWVFRLTAGEPEPCTVPVAPVSWTAAKGLYRD